MRIALRELARATAWVLCAVLIVLACGGCGAPRRGPAVPAEWVDRATPIGRPEVRSWDMILNDEFLAELEGARQREVDYLASIGHTGSLPPANFLALSGGGSNGAFGAGLLCGWSAAGTRPQFNVVTGVSTGALTAPFAFLGSEYDEKLRQVYTSVRTRQIFVWRGLSAAVFDDAMTDSTPLRRLLESLVDEEMMHDIAREHRRGRVLVVATTNLDLNRGIIWNVGAIAASGHPGSLKLIHDVLIASASIPAAFPPVMIEVEADGARYQEMHVDGGVKAQVFLYPPSFGMAARAAGWDPDRRRTAYVIRNSRLTPEPQEVRRRTMAIAGRSISAMIHGQSLTDLARIYLTAKRDNVDFNLASIPETFQMRPEEHFDPVFMTELFQTGYSLATAPGGYPWLSEPPMFAELRQSENEGATPARE